jgi:hypothetical protein
MPKRSANRISRDALVADIGAAKRAGERAEYFALLLDNLGYTGLVTYARQHWGIGREPWAASGPLVFCAPHLYTSEDARGGSAAVLDFYYKHHAGILPKHATGTLSCIGDVLSGFARHEARIRQAMILVRTPDQRSLCAFRRRNMANILGDLQSISVGLQSHLQYFDILDSLLCGARIAPAAKSSTLSG